ncbi:hypothetical protein [Myxococcus faecalis]|uniref:hypothetical protein n=1 Tax=Myxococcus faecalis TaxID=3115646 RepID=UPI003CF9EA8A
MSDNKITLWSPMDVVPVPKEAQTAAQLALYARQLSPREVEQVVTAFQNGSYELGSVFVWQKTMAGLKKKLGALGMEFIAEMLDRRDISASSNPQQVLTDHDALHLAEQLGFFPSTHTLRLRHAMQVISHFADPPPDVANDGMMPEEATGSLRTCIQTVLGHTQAETAVEFAKFRKALEERSFKLEDEEVKALAASPYFFRRTTLRVLLATIKIAQGASLEHALANLNTFLPMLWEELLHPDKQSVGWCYMEVHAEGRQTAAVGVRAALLKVKGFDYVPESLRSRSYLEAAQKILDAHFSFGNYYLEPSAISALEELGTTIPAPALAKCITAILCVKLGNHYGTSWAAVPVATRLLQSLTEDRWSYYLNECLPADDTILGKLIDSKIAPRFVELVREFNLGNLLAKVPRVQRLLEFGTTGKPEAVMSEATRIFQALRVANSA